MKAALAFFALLLLLQLLLLQVGSEAAPQSWLSPDTWRLSYPQGYLAATTVGEVALFAGGNNEIGDPYRVVDLFNLSSGERTSARLFQPRVGPAAASSGNLAFFAGGVNGYSDLTDCSVVDVYNATSNRWTWVTIHQTCDASVTLVGDLVLFAGGIWPKQSAHGPDCSVVIIYNVTSNRWRTTFCTLSQPRTGITATTVGNLALFAGGGVYNSTPAVSKLSDVVDIFDVSTGLWNTGRLSLPRMGISVTSVRDLALFAGGYTTDVNGNVERVDRVDIYNASSNQWSVAHLSQARSQMAAMTVGDVAIFGGGYNDKLGGPQVTVDAYNASSGWWFMAGLRLSEARSSLAATSVGGLALFAGGFSTTGYAVPTLDVFNASAHLVSPSAAPSATPSVSPTASIFTLSVSPSSSTTPSLSPSVSPSTSPAITPLPPSHLPLDHNGSSDNKLALGFGLGVGVTVVGGLIVVGGAATLYYVRKRQRTRASFDYQPVLQL
ncbi:kelch repeat-containing protein [Acanthamoeba castellanii str. Neff]|uniref:Kelch repeat-containing protein n=1 Tax=Acanthamoeba castellanii (strain ATCC 30010 / Neff) TaxID=1257118 RepID=L8GYG5_ACACF|nr:kelch repeat-containing protein [Acanthamoeba castellanii str. Neff]ELR18030.1 kelch repeat-containing protein [Acanthamoeba castellanii str. Neff]